MPIRPSSNWPSWPTSSARPCSSTWPRSRSSVPRPSNWPMRCVAANNRQLQDPKRLAELIKQLQDPAEDVARAGDGRLAGRPRRRRRGAGRRLADPAGGDEQPSPDGPGRDGLAAAGPMLAVLAGGEPDMKVQAIQVLDRLRAPEATPLPAGAAVPAAGSDPRVRAAADAVLTRLLGTYPTQAAGGANAARSRPPRYLQRRQPIRGEMDGRVDALALGRGQEPVRGRQLCGRATPRGCWPPGWRATPSPSRPRVARSGSFTWRRCWKRRWTVAGWPRARRREGPGRPRSRPPRRAAVNDALEYALANRLLGGGHRGGASARPVRQGPDALRTARRRRRWCKRPATPTAASAWRPWRRSWAATGRAAGRLQPRAGIALFLRRHQRRPPGPGRRPQRRPPCGNWRRCSAPLGYQTDMAASGREAIRLAPALARLRGGLHRHDHRRSAGGAAWCSSFATTAARRGCGSGCWPARAASRRRERIAGEDPALHGVFPPARPGGRPAGSCATGHARAARVRRLPRSGSRRPSGRCGCLAAWPPPRASSTTCSGPRTRSWRPCTCRS